LYAFKERNFLGPIREISFFCRASENDHVGATVISPGETVQHLSLAIGATLTEDHFKAVFHSIWLRQARATLDIMIFISGFQDGAEGSFEEPDDISSFVLNGSAAMQTRFVGLSLQNVLSCRPPDLPPGN
jgi:hypothetical protein